MSNCCELRHIPGKGRALFATAPICAGQTVLKEAPSILVIPVVNTATVCATCTKVVQPDAALPCGLCSQATFCSPDCAARGAADPGVHSPAICAAFQAVARAVGEGVLPRDTDSLDAVKFVVQALALKAAGEGGDAEAAERYAAVQRTCGAAPSDTQPSSLATSLCLTLRLEPGLHWREVDGLLSKDDQNTFALLLPQTPGDANRHARAFALYDRCSSLNHDCMPNGARCDPTDGWATGNPRMLIKALHSISQGQEIVISYTPLDWTLSDRRDFLQEHYGFACGCERCWAEEKAEEGAAGAVHPSGHSLEELDAYLDLWFAQYVCPGEDCGGTLIPLGARPSDASECNVCGGQKTAEERAEAVAAAQQHGH